MARPSKTSMSEIPGKVMRRLRRLRRMVYYEQTMVLFARPITLDSNPDYEYQIKNHDEHPEVIELLKGAYPKRVEVIDQRVRQGLKLLVVVTPENELVASCWFGIDPFVDPAGQFEIPMGKEDIYSYDGIVEPQYRRSKVAAGGYDMFLNHFWPLGRRRVIAAVDAKNVPALKWHYHVGFREMGQKVETTFIFRRPHHKWSTYIPEEGPPKDS